MPPPNKRAQQKIAELKRRVQKLQALILRYKAIKNTLNNSFYTATRVNTYRYSKPKNYKILLYKYMNAIKGRKPRRNENNENNNETENDYENRYRRRFF
jgi:hypothetical protein